MRINRLALLVVLAVLGLAFWRPIRVLYGEAEPTWTLSEFETLFFIALGLLVLRVLLAGNSDKGDHDAHR